eukprot:comp21052_c0_seq1/m.28318 comp21052_c0_seq1/g.28318  ORF comp21052_c0_seq1/g.28318 comp21052_c0_seq1/m.28318 type:complete len:106 (-) comp21052_c0_seq1:303-620(-)
MPKAEKKAAPAAAEPYSKEKKAPAKKEKKEKDPNAPKRPLTAYILFCNANRNKLREQNPDMKVPEIGTKLGAMWKTLSENERKKYDAMASEDKKRYERAMEQYNA